MSEGSGGGAGSYEGDASPFQHPARRPLLQRLVPITEHVPGYRGGTLRRDLLAGVTVAALALPSSLAYAEIAGLSPVIGLVRPAAASGCIRPLRLLTPADRRTRRVDCCNGRGRGDSVGRDPEQRASLAALLALLVGAVFLGAWAGPAGLDCGLLLTARAHRVPPRYCGSPDRWSARQAARPEHERSDLTRPDRRDRSGDRRSQLDHPGGRVGKPGSSCSCSVGYCPSSRVH